MTQARPVTLLEYLLVFWQVKEYEVLSYLRKNYGPGVYDVKKYICLTVRDDTVAGSGGGRYQGQNLGTRAQ